jgi:hypothetical protein
MKNPALFCLVALLPLAALADTYRWVDARGQVHYSQTRPTSGDYTTVGPVTPPSAAPNQDELGKAMERGIKDDAKGKERDVQEAQNKSAKDNRCKTAQERLAYLQAKTAHRLMTTDPQGNPVRMSDETFQQEVDAAQQKIKQDCAG